MIGIAASGGWIEFVLEFVLRAIFGMLRGWDDWEPWGFTLVILAATIALIWIVIRMRAKSAPSTIVRVPPDSNERERLRQHEVQSFLQHGCCRTDIHRDAFCALRFLSSERDRMDALRKIYVDAGEVEIGATLARAVQLRQACYTVSPKDSDTLAFEELKRRLATAAPGCSDGAYTEAWHFLKYVNSK